MPVQVDSLRGHFATDDGPALTLSIAILVFGLLVMAGVLLVMTRQGKGWGPVSAQMFGLALVITAGLFLIVAGYSQEQIAPMIGLLGTIAGYLLGKGAKSDS